MDEAIKAELVEKLGEERAQLVLGSYTETLKAKEELAQEKERILAKNQELLGKLARKESKEAQEFEQERQKALTLEEQLRQHLEEQNKLREELKGFKNETRNGAVREKIIGSIGDKVVSGSTADVVQGVFSSLRFEEDGQPYMLVGDRKITKAEDWVDKFLEMKPWFKGSKMREGAASGGSTGASASEVDALKKKYNELKGSSAYNSKAQALTIKRKLVSMGENVD